MGPERPQRVLIAGGGVAALEAALALRALAEDRVTVELLAPEPHFWYRPLAVAEPFGLGEVRRFELPKLAAAAGASFTLGALASVDTARYQVRTSADAVIPYDVLLVACGAVPTTAVPGALTFRGPADVDTMRQLLGEIEGGEVRRVTFAVPWGSAWSLPAYELALLTSAYLAARDVSGVELALVTPEEVPLYLFGPPASEAIAELLRARGVALHTGAYPAEFAGGELRLVPEGRVAADRVVALPRLRGPRFDGLLQNVNGFVSVDQHCRVHGFDDVFAAGDITTFPLKQGGIAAQQAVAAAEAIAESVGADHRPRPFRPVLRGLLLTGAQARYLRRDLAGGLGEDAWAASTEPLWWPPAKIVGPYLAPFLAGVAGVETPRDEGPVPGTVQVEVELDHEEVERFSTPGFGRDPAPAADGGQTVADVMTEDPLVVAPEDTLGEVAEKMRELEVGSAVVADFGRLVGILTSRDLLRAFAGRVHSSEARVREWMTAEPVTVPADAALETAVTLMTEYGIHHLPVVEDDRPVGMVGLRQAARTVIRRPPIGLGF